MKRFHPIRGKTVYIIFCSKGLGDTLAWFPYVEQFRVDNNCKVKLFIPNKKMIPLLKPNYPEIEFLREDEYIRPFGDGKLCFTLPLTAEGIISYKIGYDNGDIRRPDGRQWIPLQQSCSEILGLPFVEKRPNLHYKNYGRPMESKYVCIATHSRGPQLKYWNRPGGWDNVVKYLHSKGYEVLDIDFYEDESRDGYDNKIPNGVIKSQGKPLDVRINELEHSEFFIGLASGMSWLSWAMNKWSIMIHGFSEPWFEFQHKSVHVYPKDENICTGCWHSHDMTQLLQTGDWRVCPEHRGTNKEFECSKEITPQMVYKAIDKVIENT
jgi:autotransporter strand-loop-strand O-heptosyltransferase